jgi:hypothetical protein
MKFSQHKKTRAGMELYLILEEGLNVFCFFKKPKRKKEANPKQPTQELLSESSATKLI